MAVLLSVIATVFLLRGYNLECEIGGRKEDASPVHDLEHNMTFQCPYVSTCNYDQNVLLTTSNYDIDEVRHNRSCCRPCDTTHLCKMECCPELVPCTLSSDPPSEGQRMCIPLVFGNGYGDHEHGILVIATCKEGSNKIQQAMCLQKYDDNIDSPLDVVPVTDYRTLKVYRNVHCANCNDVEIRGVKYWLLNIVCKHSTYIASLSEALYKCQVKYRNPYPGTPTPKCSFVINSCNLTGKPPDVPLEVFDLYNPEIKELCEQSPDVAREYVYKDNMIFKNVNCFFCNGFGEGRKVLTPWIRSLSFVLGVDELGKLITKTSNACPPGMVFLQQKGQCSDARCSVLRHLHNNACKKHIQLVESFTYRIIFRIKSEVQLKVSRAYDLANQIGEIVHAFLLSVFKSYTYIYHQAILIVDTKEITTTDIMNASLIYIEIQTELKFNMLHDPEERLKILLSKETRFTLSVDGTVSYITLMIKDGFLGDKEYLNFIHCQTNFIVFGTYGLCFVDKGNLFTHGNFTFVPFYGNISDPEKNVERNILEYRDCVFVKIQMTGTDWQDTGNGLQFTKAGLFLSFHEFVYGESDDVIWVCLETYHRLYSYAPRISPTAYLYLYTYLLLCAAKTRY